MARYYTTVQICLKEQRTEQMNNHDDCLFRIVVAYLIKGPQGHLHCNTSNIQ